MGAGIAQVAAQAGHAVLLFDAREGAAAAARAKLAATLDGLAAKGKLDAGEAKAIAARIGAAARLDGAARRRRRRSRRSSRTSTSSARCSAQLEPIVGERAILASNTSSISITALANGLKRPGRLVGMHFFNPVPLMKLVEVVSGLQTDAAVAAAIFDARAGLGQDAGARALDAGLHRQPHRPARTTPRRSRCCTSGSPSRRRSTPACAAPAFAWGRAS